MSYAGGFGKVLMPHIVEKEIVQDDGSVVKRLDCMSVLCDHTVTVLTFTVCEGEKRHVRTLFIQLLLFSSDPEMCSVAIIDADTHISHYWHSWYETMVPLLVQPVSNKAKWQQHMLMFAYALLVSDACFSHVLFQRARERTGCELVFHFSPHDVWHHSFKRASPHLIWSNNKASSWTQTSILLDVTTPCNHTSIDAIQLKLLGI